MVGSHRFDSQALKVYEAEDEILEAIHVISRFERPDRREKLKFPLGHKPRLTNTETRRLIHSICKEYKCSLPRMRLGSNRKIAPLGMWASAGRGAITLPRWAKQPLVVCHEMAHYVLSECENIDTNYKLCGHDEVFCAVYIDIVARFMKAYVAEALTSNMKIHKIHIDFSALEGFLYNKSISLDRGCLSKITDWTV